MNAQLETLLKHPGIWRGDRLEATALPGIATGHAGLDALLPGGGWPRGALTELVVEAEGSGELSLLLPALASISRDDRWVALIAPPHLPYAPALAAAGVVLSRLIRVASHGAEDTLWAMEQALRSGACGAVLAWPDGINERAQRRLQLAAEAGASWGVWFTPARQAATASAAALRLRLSPVAGGTEIRFLKRRGGGPVPPLVVNCHHALARPALPRPGPAGLSVAA
jgi:hypothetical protein